MWNKIKSLAKNKTEHKIPSGSASTVWGLRWHNFSWKIKKPYMDGLAHIPAGLLLTSRHFWACRRWKSLQMIRHFLPKLSHVLRSNCVCTSPCPGWDDWLKRANIQPDYIPHGQMGQPHWFMTVYDDPLLKYTKILLGVVVLSTFILAILGVGL